jgi:hypothetical protein
MLEHYENVKQFFKAVGLEAGMIIAGFFGALASVSKDKKMTFIEKFISVVVGIAVSNYLTPIVFDWTNAGENSKYGIAFLLGYTGLKSVEYIIDKTKSKFDKKTD